MYVCERSFADPLIYLLRSQVQKCGYQFISAFERRRVLDTPVTKGVVPSLRVSPVILHTHTLRKFADEKKYAVEA
jgi:hypothetical protein